LSVRNYPVNSFSTSPQLDTRREATAWRLRNSAPDSISGSISSANEWWTNGTVYLSM